MSDYSKVNLLEIESSSKTEGLEMRFARKYLDSRDLGISLSRYAPNYEAKTAHSHVVQEEAYVVIRGSGHIMLNKKIVKISLWDVIRVAPEVIRAFKAGPDGLDIIAVGGPKPDDGDGVRHDLSWPNEEDWTK
jgi:mannose-6-phosphate isomerase-like protein (cupin superfamily)